MFIDLGLNICPRNYFQKAENSVQLVLTCRNALCSRMKVELDGILSIQVRGGCTNGDRHRSG